MFSNKYYFALKILQKNWNNIEKQIAGINSLIFEQFSLAHSSILSNKVKKIYFYIAGNINKELVQTIHNYIKEKIPINNLRLLLEEPVLKEDDTPSVVNYYQKSEIDNPKKLHKIFWTF